MITSVALLEQLAGRAAAFETPMEVLDFAKRMDHDDVLRAHRSEFYFPVRGHHETSLGAVDEKSYRYFCGNSLGLQHKDVERYVQDEVKKWRMQAVEGHFLKPNPWFEIDDILRADMAKLVGAKDSEVVIMNSLTANLHLLLSAFYKPCGRRTKLVSENFPFPSDTHAFVSQVLHHGLNPDEDYITIPGTTLKEPGIISTESILNAIAERGEEIAVLVIGAVHFLTGQYFDIQRIVEAAHSKGILVGVDAAHAAGNLPLRLHDWGVDFACWCTYKYINAGPGNIAGLFVHERHTSQLHASAGDHSSGPSPLRGWWGHCRSNRFSLHREFDASVGAAAFQLSNPCVLSIMSLAPSLRLMSSIGIDTLRSKSLLLTRYMEHLLDTQLSHAVDVITPRDPLQRGCQLSIRIRSGALREDLFASSEAYACGNDLKNDADKAQRLLLDEGVMCDNRPPDILRLAPVPLYNSFEDVWQLVHVLGKLFVKR